MIKYSQDELNKILYRLDGPLRNSIGENKELAALALADRGQRLLDLGAGSGYITLEAAKIIGDLGQIVALDFSEDLLMVLSEKAQTQGVASLIKTVVSKAEQIPYPDAYFDAVVTSFLFHEVDNLPAVIKEIRRVLRPGGRLVFSDFRRLEDPIRTKQIESWYEKADLDDDDEIHLKYTIEEIKELLLQNRFTRIEVHPWVDYHMRGIAIRSI